MDSALAGWRLTVPGWRAAVQEILGGATFPARADESGSARDYVAARLSRIGARLRESREAWAEERFEARDSDDAVARLWREWGEGNPWPGQEAWTKLLLRPVTRSFRLALASRPPPPHVVERAIGDLRDALYYQLVGGGFAEVAAYVLETAPGGPVAPVYEALSPTRRALVARCVSRRGHWPRTVSAVLPAAGAGERALRLLDYDGAEPEDWIELHVLLRLLDAWAEEPGDDDRDWSIVAQNQGRARGRLRAVVMLEPAAHLAGAVADLPRLTQRTRAAARRWAWAWAWEEVARGFAFHIEQTVIRPCRADEGDVPLDEAAMECLESWLLLVILRGRGSTVRRWCVDGAGDTDGTWGRLLKLLPAELRDVDGGYVRVRVALSDRWSELCGALGPLLEQIAGLPTSRTLKVRFWEIAGRVWHETIPKPRGGFPKSVQHAAAWLADRQELETPPRMHAGEEA